MSFKFVKEHMSDSKNNTKENYDKKIYSVHFKIGDLVSIVRKQTRQGTSKEPSPIFHGNEIEVIKISLDDNNLAIKKGKKIRKYHADLLPPYIADDCRKREQTILLSFLFLNPVYNNYTNTYIDQLTGILLYEKKDVVRLNPNSIN